jgi:hypothetical protein
MRLVGFYEGLGFRETFRTPEEGTPIHVEVTLDGFTIGIADADSARADHGLRPSLDGRPVEILLWTDDTDRDYERLTADGAPSLSPVRDPSPPGASRHAVSRNSFRPSGRTEGPVAGGFLDSCCAEGGDRRATAPRGLRERLLDHCTSASPTHGLRGRAHETARQELDSGRRADFRD